MHASPAVVLGCADCHGGDAKIFVQPNLKSTDKAYVATRDKAHVLPRYPQSWHWPSSANPKRGYTLLNKESPEYIRFVNPADYRVVRQSCGACHMEIIEAGERSLMATGAMLWGGAAYNNGIVPYKNYLFGEAYTDKGEPAKIVSPGEPFGTVTPEQKARGALPEMYPLPTWHVVPPGDVFRVFERGGRNIGTQFPEIGLPNPSGNIQRLEEPGRPDLKQSNRGPATGLRVAIPILNVHKTRLNDPFMWFMGTNDQPGDYRNSGCAGCHVVYANDREPRHSLTYAKYGRDGQSATVDPTIANKVEHEAEDDHGKGHGKADVPCASGGRGEGKRPPDPARLHPRDPDRPVHELPHAPAQHLPEQLSRLHDVGL
jgi:mono/diheme cytochrome c family protein